MKTIKDILLLRDSSGDLLAGFIYGIAIFAIVAGLTLLFLNKI